MTVQKMKATKTQTNRFLDGFQTIQNTVMGTTCKQNIPHYKCQLMMESILHKLPTISLYQQRSIPQRLCMMMSQMRIDMNTIHIRILFDEYKTISMFLKIHISRDGMQITPDGSIFSPRNLRRQNYLCLVIHL